MTTPLTKPLRRALTVDGRIFIVTMSPETLKITLKGKRRGQEIRWTELIGGDTALAAALNASLGTFDPGNPGRTNPGRTK